MADLSSILTDPNYVNANPATKQAIFDKFSANDTNFTSANPETQNAIRTKFGLAAPSGGVPVGRRQNAWDTADAADIIAGLPLTRFAMGAAAPIMGIAQLGANIATKFGLDPKVSTAIAEHIAHLNQMKQRGMAALGEVSPVDIMGMAGSAATGGAATSGIAPAASYLGRVAQSAGLGAGLGVTSPSETPGLGAQAKQAVMGAVLGGATTALAPVAQFGYNAFARPLVDRAAVKNAFLERISEGKMDELRRLANTAEANVPGATLTGPQAVAPAQVAKFASAAESVKSKLGSEYFAAEEANNAARLAHAARVNTDLSAKEQALAATLANESQLATGKALTENAAAQMKKVQASEVTPAYEAAFTAAPEATIDISPVLTVAKSIQAGELETLKPELAPKTSKLLSLYAPKPAPSAPLGAGKVSSKLTAPAATPEPPPLLTLREADAILKAINIDRAALKSSTDSSANVARANLNELYSAVDNAITTGVSTEAKTAHDAARQLFKDKVADVFYKGAPANLRRQTSINEPMLAPEDIIPKVLSSEGNATQFLKTVQTPEAKATLAKGIESAYRDAVVNPKTGVIDPAKHVKFMSDNAPALGAIDAAGISITPRLNAIGTKAEQQAATRATAEANKLAPSAPNVNALAIQDKIRAAEAAATPQALVDPTAIGRDLEREALNLRLSAASGEKGTNIATQASETKGVHWFNQTATLAKSIIGRLEGRIDDKMAKEIAQDFLTKEGTAKALSAAIIAAKRSDNFKKAFKDAYGAIQAGKSAVTTNALSSENSDVPRFILNNMAPGRP